MQPNQHINHYMTPSENETPSVSEPLSSILKSAEPITQEDLHLQELEFQKMLKNIARREAEAKAYAQGARDWVVSEFHAALGPGQEYTPQLTRDEMRQQGFSRWKIQKIRDHQRNAKAADVYWLRRRGLSSEEAARELGLSLEEVSDALHIVINLYDQTHRGCDETPEEFAKHPGKYRRRGLLDPHAQTSAALYSRPYWIFQKQEGDTTRYCFSFKTQQLGAGSVSEGGKAPIVLQCGNLILNSSFDPGQAVVSGISRRIVDADNATAEVARLTWLEEGLYELRLNWDTGVQAFRIQSEEDNHQFYLEDRLVARIAPLPLPQKLNNWELRLCMHLIQPFPDETAMLLMSFPLLRFAK